MKNKKVISNTVAILSVLLLSCAAASDPPIDGAQKLFIKKYIEIEDGSNLYKVVSFDKMDSTKITYPLDNKDVYLVAYMCRIELTDNCYVMESEHKTYVNILPSATTLDLKKQRPSGWTPKAIQEQYKPFEKGRQFAIQGILAFRKTDKGWSYLPLDAKELD
ncbi:MAG: hypothetical protein C4567_17825 [Deltaproteobacteria bacterium]|nr:MAG: hypothetical protein C4567_17825 [Deltaproteobacteria bacterium]